MAKHTIVRNGFICAVKWNKNKWIFSRSSTNLSKVWRSLSIVKSSPRSIDIMAAYKWVIVHIGCSRFILIHLTGLIRVLDLFCGSLIETDSVDELLARKKN